MEEKINKTCMQIDIFGRQRQFKNDRQSDVPLYFVLYYTLNRSGEIHGKK